MNHSFQMCRPSRPRFICVISSRPYGRAYSLPPLRGSCFDCHRKRDVLSFTPRVREPLHCERDMKRIPKDSLGRSRGDVMVAFAIILLLFPSSGSALCIAPGGHVAIEDVNAACCAPSTISIRGENQPGNGFAAAGDCQNCTDLFLLPNTREAVLESRDTVAPNSPADASLSNHIPVDASSSPRRSAAIRKIDAPVAIPSSVPLRC